MTYDLIEFLLGISDGKNQDFNQDIKPFIKC